MQYVQVNSSLRKGALIALKPINWGTPYQQLFYKTDISGYERWLAESANNFNNPVAKAMEALYNQRGAFCIIFCDIVEEGVRGVDDKGRLDVFYTSHACTEWEKTHRVAAPPPGWYVPTNDDIFSNGVWIPFYQGTLIPRETMQDRNEAVRRLEARGIDPEWVSYFCRPDRYKEKRFVGRGFTPSEAYSGQFFIYADGLLSRSGDDRVASLPAYNEAFGKPEIVMEVDEPDLLPENNP